MEKVVKISYKEYQNLLTELEHYKTYSKELEDRDNIIIIDRSYRSSIPEVIKGVELVTDKLKELRAELNLHIQRNQDEFKAYNNMRLGYEQLLRKLRKNWIYRVFYDK